MTDSQGAVFSLLWLPEGTPISSTGPGAVIPVTPALLTTIGFAQTWLMGTLNAPGPMQLCVVYAAGVSPAPEMLIPDPDTNRFITPAPDEPWNLFYPQVVLTIVPTPSDQAAGGEHSSGGPPRG